MNTSWVVVIGTLGGVLITTTAGLLTAYLSGRQRAAEAERQASLDRETQIRNERRTIYMEYLSAYRAMYTRAHVLDPDTLPADEFAENNPRKALWAFEQAATMESQHYNSAYYAVLISGSKETRDAAETSATTLRALIVKCVTRDRDEIEHADSETHEPRRRLRDAMRKDLGID